ncbi:hypothetical protein [Aminobacter phage Erebus]|nr:hypothetical protein [Aminobacter phage Erebus]
MAIRLYQEKKTGKIVHAKPSASQPGIIVYQADIRGKAGGRILALTVDEFNDRFAIVTSEGAAA